MQELLKQLCSDVASALGAAVCDADGESLALALGQAEWPEAGWKVLEAGLPRHFSSEGHSNDESKRFVLRQWAAEPSRSSSQLMRAHLNAGSAMPSAFTLRFDELELLVHVLQEQMYLVLILRRPCLSAPAARQLSVIGPSIKALLSRDFGY